MAKARYAFLVAWLNRDTGAGKPIAGILYLAYLMHSDMKREGLTTVL